MSGIFDGRYRIFLAGVAVVDPLGLGAATPLSRAALAPEAAHLLGSIGAQGHPQPGRHGRGYRLDAAVGVALSGCGERDFRRGSPAVAHVGPLRRLRVSLGAGCASCPLLAAPQSNSAPVAPVERRRFTPRCGQVGSPPTGGPLLIPQNDPGRLGLYEVRRADPPEEQIAWSAARIANAHRPWRMVRGRVSVGRRMAAERPRPWCVGVWLYLWACSTSSSSGSAVSLVAAGVTAMSQSGVASGDRWYL